MYTVTKRERNFTLAGIMVALFLGGAGPDDRRHCNAEDPPDTERAEPLHVGGDRVPPGLHRNDPHLRKALRPVRQKGRGAHRR